MAGATPVARALRGCCPRCGEGALFQGVIAFRPRCSACGLDYLTFNVGDGAATFLIFIVGVIVVGLAMWVELSFEPPWWVHALLWLPLTVALTVGLLRIAKAILIAQEYANDAREGRLD